VIFAFLRLLVGHLSVRLALFRISFLLFSEGGRLLSEFDPVRITLLRRSVLARSAPVIVASAVAPMAATVAAAVASMATTISTIATSGISLVPLRERLALFVSLLTILLALLSLVSLTLFVFLGVLLRRHISVLLEGFLCQQEVDLHDEISAFKVLLSMEADHIVKGLRLILVVDMEHHTQFILAVLVANRLCVDVFSLKGLQVLKKHNFLLSAVLLLGGGLFIAILAAAEHVDLEGEGTGFEANRLAEELRVPLVIETIV